MRFVAPRFGICPMLRLFASSTRAATLTYWCPSPWNGYAMTRARWVWCALFFVPSILLGTVTSGWSQSCATEYTGSRPRSDRLPATLRGYSMRQRSGDYMLSLSEACRWSNHAPQNRPESALPTASQLAFPGCTLRRTGTFQSLGHMRP